MFAHVQSPRGLLGPTSSSFWSGLLLLLICISLSPHDCTSSPSGHSAAIGYRGSRWLPHAVPAAAVDCINEVITGVHAGNIARTCPPGSTCTFRNVDAAAIMVEKQAGCSLIFDHVVLSSRIVVWGAGSGGSVVMAEVSTRQVQFPAMTGLSELTIENVTLTLGNLAFSGALSGTPGAAMTVRNVDVSVTSGTACNTLLLGSVAFDTVLIEDVSVSVTAPVTGSKYLLYFENVNVPLFIFRRVHVVYTAAGSNPNIIGFHTAAIPAATFIVEDVTAIVTGNIVAIGDFRYLNIPSLSITVQRMQVTSVAAHFRSIRLQQSSFVNSFTAAHTWFHVTSPNAVMVVRFMGVVAVPNEIGTLTVSNMTVTEPSPVPVVATIVSLSFASVQNVVVDGLTLTTTAATSLIVGQFGDVTDIQTVAFRGLAIKCAANVFIGEFTAALAATSVTVEDSSIVVPTAGHQVAIFMYTGHVTSIGLLRSTVTADGPTTFNVLPYGGGATVQNVAIEHSTVTVTAAPSSILLANAKGTVGTPATLSIVHSTLDIQGLARRLFHELTLYSVAIAWSTITVTATSTLAYFLFNGNILYLAFEHSAVTVVSQGMQYDTHFLAAAPPVLISNTTLLLTSATSGVFLLHPASSTVYVSASSVTIVGQNTVAFSKGGTVSSVAITAVDASIALTSATDAVYVVDVNAPLWRVSLLRSHIALEGNSAVAFVSSTTTGSEHTLVDSTFQATRNTAGSMVALYGECPGCSAAVVLLLHNVTFAASVFSLQFGLLVGTLEATLLQIDVPGTHATAPFITQAEAAGLTTHLAGVAFNSDSLHLLALPAAGTPASGASTVRLSHTSLAKVSGPAAKDVTPAALVLGAGATVDVTVVCLSIDSAVQTDFSRFPVAAATTAVIDATCGALSCSHARDCNVSSTDAVQFNAVLGVCECRCNGTAPGGVRVWSTAPPRLQCPIPFRTATDSPTLTMSHSPPPTPTASSTRTGPSVTATSTDARTATMTLSSARVVTHTTTVVQTESVTSTVTRSLTSSITATASLQRSATLTLKATATQTSSRTDRQTSTVTVVHTLSRTVPATPTHTVPKSPTVTTPGTPSSTPTVSMSRSRTPGGGVPTATVQATRTPSPSPSRSPTRTPRPTATASVVATRTGTTLPTSTRTTAPTVTTTLTVSASNPLSVSKLTAATSPTATLLPSRTVTVAVTPSRTVGPTITYSASLTLSQRTMSVTRVFTNTASLTKTPVESVSVTPTTTRVASMTVSLEPSPTTSTSGTRSVSVPLPHTATSTATATVSKTAVLSVSRTTTLSLTMRTQSLPTTATVTVAGTRTETPTLSGQSVSPTPASTRTATSVATATVTRAATTTPSSTVTVSRKTDTATGLVSVTGTATMTVLRASPTASLLTTATRTMSRTPSVPTTATATLTFSRIATVTGSVISTLTHGRTPTASHFDSKTLTGTATLSGATARVSATSTLHHSATDSVSGPTPTIDTSLTSSPTPSLPSVTRTAVVSVSGTRTATAMPQRTPTHGLTVSVTRHRTTTVSLQRSPSPSISFSPTRTPTMERSRSRTPPRPSVVSGTVTVSNSTGPARFCPERTSTARRQVGVLRITGQRGGSCTALPSTAVPHFVNCKPTAPATPNGSSVTTLLSPLPAAVDVVSWWADPAVRLEASVSALSEAVLGAPVMRSVTDVVVPTATLQRFFANDTFGTVGVHCALVIDSTVAAAGVPFRVFFDVTANTTLLSGALDLRCVTTSAVDPATVFAATATAGGWAARPLAVLHIAPITAPRVVATPPPPTSPTASSCVAAWPSAGGDCGDATLQVRLRRFHKDGAGPSVAEGVVSSPLTFAMLLNATAGNSTGPAFSSALCLASVTGTAAVGTGGDTASPGSPEYTAVAEHASLELEPSCAAPHGALSVSVVAVSEHSLSSLLTTGDVGMERAVLRGPLDNSTAALVPRWVIYGRRSGEDAPRVTVSFQPAATPPPSVTCAAACTRHGTCEYRQGGAWCACSDGFSGVACESCAAGRFGPECRQCPGLVCDAAAGAREACSGHGACNDGLRGDGSCVCAATTVVGFWGGEECGDCTDYAFGPQCSLCPGALTPAGVCGGHGRCASGTRGSGGCTCAFPFALSGDLCIGCNTGYFGANCTACPSDCGSDGRCDDGPTGSGECVCQPGFFGPSCGVACGLDSCVNGDCAVATGECVCRAGWGGRRCDDCDAAHHGPTCALLCDPSCSTTADASAVLRCDSGVNGTGGCACPSGRWGPGCGAACPADSRGAVCGGHGECDLITGRCICTSSPDTGYWAGVVCDQCQASYVGSPGCTARCPIGTSNLTCSGAAACEDGVCVAPCGPVLTATTVEASLRCGAACGITGGVCSANNATCDRLVCLGRGICLDRTLTLTATAHGPPRCFCTGGSGGADCSLTCPTNAPDATGFLWACSGRGLCEAIGSGSAIGECRCHYGYWGAACERQCPRHPTTGEICSGAGLCDSVTGRCQCTVRGTVGAACEASCPVSPLGEVCSGHGMCLETGCLCDAAFAGIGCADCAPGLAGPSCDLRCGDGALLSTGGACVCLPGRAGPSCRLTCPVDSRRRVCSGHGQCRDGNAGDGSCDCSDGWYGTLCNVPCSPSRCLIDSGLVHATCNATGGCECRDDDVSGHFTGAVCDDCHRGFWGPLCTVPCSCNGHGACDRFSGACRCDWGLELGHWAGANCEECGPGFLGVGCRGIDSGFTSLPHGSLPSVELELTADGSQRWAAGHRWPSAWDGDRQRFALLAAPRLLVITDVLAQVTLRHTIPCGATDVRPSATGAFTVLCRTTNGLEVVTVDPHSNATLQAVLVGTQRSAARGVVQAQTAAPLPAACHNPSPLLVAAASATAVTVHCDATSTTAVLGVDVEHGSLFDGPPTVRRVPLPSWSEVTGLAVSGTDVLISGSLELSQGGVVSTTWAAALVSTVAPVSTVAAVYTAAALGVVVFPPSSALSCAVARALVFGAPRRIVCFIALTEGGDVTYHSAVWQIDGDAVVISGTLRSAPLLRKPWLPSIVGAPHTDPRYNERRYPAASAVAAGDGVAIAAVQGHPLLPAVLLRVRLHDAALTAERSLPDVAGLPSAVVSAAPRPVVLIAGPSAAFEDRAVVAGVAAFGIVTVSPSVVDARGGTALTLTVDVLPAWVRAVRCGISGAMGSMAAASSNTVVLNCVAPTVPPRDRRCVEDGLSLGLAGFDGTAHKWDLLLKAARPDSVTVAYPPAVALITAVTGTPWVSAAARGPAGGPAVLAGRNEALVRITVHGSNFVVGAAAAACLLISGTVTLATLPAVAHSTSIAVCSAAVGALPLTMGAASLVYTHDGLARGASDVGVPVIVSGVATTVFSSIRGPLSLPSDSTAALPAVAVIPNDAHGEIAALMPASFGALRCCAYATGGAEVDPGSLWHRPWHSCDTVGVPSPGTAHPAVEGLALKNPRTGRVVVRCGPVSAFESPPLPPRLGDGLLSVIPGAPAALALLGDGGGAQWRYGIGGPFTATTRVQVGIVDAAGNAVLAASPGTVPTAVRWGYPTRRPDAFGVLSLGSVSRVALPTKAGIYDFGLPSPPLWGSVAISYRWNFTAVFAAAVNPASSASSMPILRVEIAALSCGAGTYAVKGSDSCRACPAHATCDGSSTISPHAGYWHASEGSPVLFECAPDACLEGGMCARGHDGPLCSICSAGYGRRDVAGECGQCPHVAVAAAVVAAIGVVMVGLLYLFVSVSVYSGKVEFVSMLRMFMSYLQLATWMVSVVVIAFPDFLSWVFVAARILATLDVTSLYLSCLGLSTFYRYWALVMAMPGCFTLLFCIPLGLDAYRAATAKKSDEGGLGRLTEFEEHPAVSSGSDHDITRRHSRHRRRTLALQAGPPTGGPAGLAHTARFPMGVSTARHSYDPLRSLYAGRSVAPGRAHSHSNSHLRPEGHSHSRSHDTITTDPQHRSSKRHQSAVVSRRSSVAVLTSAASVWLSPVTRRALWRWVHLSSASFFVIAFVLFPTVVDFAGRALVCDSIQYGGSIGEVHVLRADRSLSCDTAEWRVMAAASTAILVVSSVGLPLALVAAVFLFARLCFHGDVDESLALFKFIVGGFRSRLWFWEGVVLIRKVLLGLAGLLVDSPRAKMHTLLWVLGVSLALDLLFEPFANSRLLALDIVALLAIFASVNVALAASGLEAEWPGSGWVPVATVVGVNAVALLTFAVLLTQALHAAVKRYIVAIVEQYPLSLGAALRWTPVYRWASGEEEPAVRHAEAARAVARAMAELRSAHPRTAEAWAATTLLRDLRDIAASDPSCRGPDTAFKWTPSPRLVQQHKAHTAVQRRGAPRRSPSAAAEFDAVVCRTPPASAGLGAWSPCAVPPLGASLSLGPSPRTSPQPKHVTFSPPAAPAIPSPTGSDYTSLGPSLRSDRTALATGMLPPGPAIDDWSPSAAPALDLRSLYEAPRLSTTSISSQVSATPRRTPRAILFGESHHPNIPHDRGDRSLVLPPALRTARHDAIHRAVGRRALRLLGLEDRAALLVFRVTADIDGRGRGAVAALEQRWAIERGLAVAVLRLEREIVHRAREAAACHRLPVINPRLPAAAPVVVSKPAAARTAPSSPEPTRRPVVVDFASADNGDVEWCAPVAESGPSVCCALPPPAAPTSPAFAFTVDGPKGGTTESGSGASNAAALPLASFNTPSQAAGAVSPSAQSRTRAFDSPLTTASTASPMALARAPSAALLSPAGVPHLPGAHLSTNGASVFRSSRH